ncbi:MAG: hypothetical protein ACE5D6_00030 [Candidatus Zixiibacteriota bacterium]
MTTKTKIKALSLILVAVSIWAYFNLKSDTKDNTEAISTESIETIMPKKNIVNNKLVNIENKTKEKWGRDPFRNKKPKKRVIKKTRTKSISWKLSGILFNSDSPIAIINNKPVKIGDKIGNAKVITIDKKSVILEHNGNKITITVTKG